ncbi:MAG: allantoicase, partial [Deltaproteobacteria bacterium]|nr:allantoicase [Deltaproteobacteria bacterium]
MANFDHLIDLAAEALGGKALHASDEFFAPKENLLKPGRGEFIVGKYTPYGKWMDGWESRRKRVPGYDWCIIKLGLPGKIRGIDVDTNHFTGNFPEFASLDAIEAPADSTHESLRDAKWTSLVPISKLQGGSRNLFAVHSEARFTHVRLNIHPDGGVARLRVHGVVLPDWPNAGTDNGHFNLSALENGAVVVAANDMFFGHMNNLIMPGDPATMGDGWETRRKRGPGNDWIVVKLAEPGYVRRVIVDTMHFKGNYPEGFSLEGAVLPDDTPTEYFSSRAVQWVEILGLTRLHPDTCHDFRHGLNAVETVFTHVRLSIFPDGGVARLRVLGTLP